jgi:hypothetical protein
MAAILDLLSINYPMSASVMSVDWSDFWGLRGYARFAMLYYFF